MQGHEADVPVHAAGWEEVVYEGGLEDWSQRGSRGMMIADLPNKQMLDS